MSLDVGDKIGINRLGVKSYVPAVGEKCCFIGNRAIHTLPVAVGDRIGHRKYGYKSTEGETRTTCWNSIARMEFSLHHTTATIHADYTTNMKYRYQYAHYGGEYGDDYATAEIYARPDKYYCLGFVSGGTASSNITSIPSECDLYLFINGEFIDFILHDEYGVTNYKRFGNIDAYLKKDGTKEKISLYVRPYDSVSVDTAVFVDILEMDYETCLTPTRQTAGYFVTNAWKVNDAANFTAPWVNWVVGDPKPWTYDEYSLTFTAREGCIYTLMDFWDYSNVTSRPYKSYTAAYGYQWKYPWCAFNRTQPDYFGDPTYYSLAMWLNNGGTNWILTGNPCILLRGYNPYLDQVYVGYDDNLDRLTPAKGLVIGENYFVVRYPYYFSTHWVDNYWHTSGDSPSIMEYSALYLVELRSSREITPV